MQWFGLLEMETLIAKRKRMFLAKYAQCDNIIIMSVVRSSGECVTYDNLDAICCFSFTYSVYFYFHCCHLMNKDD